MTHINERKRAAHRRRVQAALQEILNDPAVMPNADCADSVVSVSRVEFGSTVAEIFVQVHGRWRLDPLPAIASIQAIRAHLTKHPEDLGFKSDPSTAHWPGELMNELAYCQTVLEEAASRGRQFRFLIVS